MPTPTVTFSSSGVNAFDSLASEDVQAVLPHLSPSLKAMVEFQRLTGCRPTPLFCSRYASDMRIAH